MMKRPNEQKNVSIVASSRKYATISAELTLSKETSFISEVCVVNFCQCILFCVGFCSSAIWKIPSPKGTGLQGLRNDLLTWLKQEFSFIHTNELIAKATVLDPHFKLNPFQQEKHSVFLTSIKDSICYSWTVPCRKEFGDTILNHVTPDSTDSSHGIWARYKHLIPSFNVTPHSHTTARDELNHYLNEPTINPESNPKAVGEHWQDSEHRRLKNVALKYLCVLSAICDVKRITLDPERVKMLIFCHKNL
ncbi:hypothetical protein PR048_013110, partial [Dryococelus australis]